MASDPLASCPCGKHAAAQVVKLVRPLLDDNAQEKLYRPWLRGTASADTERRNGADRDRLLRRLVTRLWRGVQPGSSSGQTQIPDTRRHPPPERRRLRSPIIVYCEFGCDLLSRLPATKKASAVGRSLISPPSVQPRGPLANDCRAASHTARPLAGISPPFRRPRRWRVGPHFAGAAPAKAFD
jgi:hypothetical protein